MAAVSLAFALDTALRAPLWVAVIFAILWGVAIMSLDRLFVVSMHRYSNRWYYLLLAAPRFLIAVLLGFVISTPFVLQIFRPEIIHQIELMQAAERSAYFKDLPANPVYRTVQRDKATIGTLTNQAATGGSAINPAADPVIKGWQVQLAKAQSHEQTWFANLQCQLYGTALPGGRKCIQGNGPLAKDDQEQYRYWKGQVSTLQSEIHQRTTTLSGQSAARQKAEQGQARSQLAAARAALRSAQQQLTSQTNGVTAGIKADRGLLTQLKALGRATAGNTTLGLARLLLFLVFLLIDIMPVFVKLLLNLAPESTYDVILEREERQQERLAENARAVRQAASRKAAQAEISGARDRLAALSAELPGVGDEIVAARLRVEREWLQRWEADQMRRVARGQGITPSDTGVGPMPAADGWQFPLVDSGPRPAPPGFRPWPPRSGPATRAGQAWPRQQQAGAAPSQYPRASPARPRRLAEEQLWGWLGTMRLPRPNLSRLRLARRGRQEPDMPSRYAGLRWPARGSGTGARADGGVPFPRQSQSGPADQFPSLQIPAAPDQRYEADPPGTAAGLDDVQAARPDANGSAAAPGQW